ncbi:unnamed protein product [Allacma fusca]|uniref:Uncharacterized protein n=1 Tax=Allacma fusca TaxID=39272 RepID=A0A8J2PBC0_9HEXA|nr:unnamed protein product [Allacma fusca]
MEPGEPSFDLSTIITEEDSEEQVVPVLFDRLAGGYDVELNGQLNQNIGDNHAQSSPDTPVGFSDCLELDGSWSDN